MGATIQFESHRVELPFVYEMEHDPEVLEYYDQPPSIPLAYKAANGRRLSVLHTPDYFVLRHDSAGWEECKTADELEKLAVKSPNRYHRGNKGNWCCAPGEQYASEDGLYYRIRSSAEIDWVLQRNIQFLEDYFRFDSAGTAYAFVKNRWTECHSEHYIVLQDRSEKEVMLASKEIRRRSQLH